MDEPTTHLDMASIDALIDALKQYQGTLIFISHDDYYIRALAQTVLHISAGNLTPYSGGYDYYLDKSGAASAKQGLVAGEQLSDNRPGRRAVSAPRASSSPGQNQEQKRREAEERQAVSACITQKKPRPIWNKSSRKFSRWNNATRKLWRNWKRPRLINRAAKRW